MANDDGTRTTQTLPPPTIVVVTAPPGFGEPAPPRWPFLGLLAALVGVVLYVAGTSGVGRWITALAAALGFGLFAGATASIVLAFWPRGPKYWTWNRGGRIAGMLALTAPAAFVSLHLVSRHLTGSTAPFWAGGVVGLLVGGASAADVTRRNDHDLRRSIARTGLHASWALGTALSLLVASTAVSVVYEKAKADDGAVALRPVTVVRGTYLALGDAVAAGDGVTPYLPGTGAIEAGGDDCRRSPFAYPNWLTFGEGALPVVFSACSGAEVIDLVQPRTVAASPSASSRSGAGDTGTSPTKGVQRPAQTGPVPPEQVGLVTLSIGWDDLGMNEMVQHCIEVRRCLTSPFALNGKSDGASKGTSDGTSNGTSNGTEAQPADRPPLAEAATRRLLDMSEAIAGVFDQLRAKYPTARIVVVGHPHLFPTTGPTRWPTACGSLLRRLDGTERAGLREIENNLDDRLYELAVRSGVEYVSAEALWTGHEVCGDHDGYLTRPPLVWRDTVDIVPGGRILPTRQGQQLLARQVACYLADFPAPPDYFGGTAPTRDAWPKLTALVSPEILRMRAAPGAKEAPLGDRCVRPPQTDTGR